MKDVVAKIEKLREKPLVEKPQFYLSEFNEILRRYAPCYPESINGNELFELCNAMFAIGYIKGAAHQARKSRQKPARDTKRVNRGRTSRAAGGAGNRP